jgi:hypothetical protein
MVQDVRLGNRTKSVQPYVERDFCPTKTQLTKLIDELIGEVQTCGGRRGRTWDTPVDGLVAFAIREFLPDIRRQRRFAVILETHVFIIVEPEAKLPGPKVLLDGCSRSENAGTSTRKF